MCTSFSAMGSAAILPLDPAKGYEFEVAIFGGGTQVNTQAIALTGCSRLCDQHIGRLVLHLSQPQHPGHLFEPCTQQKPHQTTF